MPITWSATSNVHTLDVADHVAAPQAKTTAGPYWVRRSGAEGHCVVCSFLTSVVSVTAGLSPRSTVQFDHGVAEERIAKAGIQHEHRRLL